MSYHSQLIKAKWFSSQEAAQMPNQVRFVRSLLGHTFFSQAELGEANVDDLLDAIDNSNCVFMAPVNAVISALNYGLPTPALSQEAEAVVHKHFATVEGAFSITDETRDKKRRSHFEREQLALGLSHSSDDVAALSRQALSTDPGQVAITGEEAFNDLFARLLKQQASYDDTSIVQPHHGCFVVIGNAVSGKSYLASDIKAVLNEAYDITSRRAADLGASFGPTNLVFCDEPDHRCFLHGDAGEEFIDNFVTYGSSNQTLLVDSLKSALYRGKNLSRGGIAKDFMSKLSEWSAKVSQKQQTLIIVINPLTGDDEVLSDLRSSLIGSCTGVIEPLWSSESRSATIAHRVWRESGRYYDRRVSEINNSNDRYGSVVSLLQTIAGIGDSTSAENGGDLMLTNRSKSTQIIRPADTKLTLDGMHSASTFGSSFMKAAVFRSGRGLIDSVTKEGSVSPISNYQVDANK